MSKILRSSHKHILKSLPDFIKEEYVFSGGTALAEYYFHHRLSDDIDFFCVSKTTSVSIDALQHALNLIGKTSYEQTHGRAIFSTEACGEIIKIDFCPLYCDRLKPPKILRHGYLVDSLDDIAANKILALCGRNEPKDFIDIYFFNKILGYDVQKMMSLAQIKEPQAYQYLVSLERAETINFDKDIYKIVTDFSESDLKTYFRQQNKIIKPSTMFWLDDLDSFKGFTNYNRNLFSFRWRGKTKHGDERMAVENTLSAGAILASKRKIETKTCPVCKEEFEGIKKAIFCSNKCRQKDKYQRNKLTQ